MKETLEVISEEKGRFDKLIEFRMVKNTFPKFAHEIKSFQCLNLTKALVF